MKKMLMILVMGVLAYFSFNTTGGYAYDAYEKVDWEVIKQEYEEFLANEIKNVKGQERTDLVNFSKLYHSSSNEAQYKIVKLLHDPEQGILKQLLNPVETSESSTILYEDDTITLVMETTFEDNAIASTDEMNILAGDEYRQAKMVVNFTADKINLMQHTSTLNYSRTKEGGVITGIQASDHYMSRNWTINSITYSGKSHTPKSFPASYARSDSNFNVALVSGTIPGFIVGHGNCYIRTDASGNTTGDYNLYTD